MGDNYYIQRVASISQALDNINHSRNGRYKLFCFTHSLSTACYYNSKLKLHHDAGGWGYWICGYAQEQRFRLNVAKSQKQIMCRLTGKPRSILHFHHEMAARSSRWLRWLFIHWIGWSGPIHVANDWGYSYVGATATADGLTWMTQSTYRIIHNSHGGK